MILNTASLDLPVEMEGVESVILGPELVHPCAKIIKEYWTHYHLKNLEQFNIIRKQVFDYLQCNCSKYYGQPPCQGGCTSYIKPSPTFRSKWPWCWSHYHPGTSVLLNMFVISAPDWKRLTAIIKIDYSHNFCVW